MPSDMRYRRPTRASHAAIPGSEAEAAGAESVEAESVEVSGGAATIGDITRSVVTKKCSYVSKGDFMTWRSQRW